ncbi:MAG: hydrogenase maturation protease [Candidatus Hodarchaeota archaeon]
MDFNDFESDLIAKLEGSNRLTIVGIGADLREDDAVGTILARELILLVKNELDEDGKASDDFSDQELIKFKNLLIINATVVPENYMTTIQEFKPDQVVFIDAANLGEQGTPGDIAFVNLEDLGRYTFSTHSISLDQVIEIMKSLGVKSKFITIGIQLKRKGYGEQLSEPVEQTKIYLLKLLSQFIKEKYLVEG